MLFLNVLFALLGVLYILFVVLVERKLWALSQRRVGPAIIGRNGIFQIFADLIKLLQKEVFLISRTANTIAGLVVSCFFASQLVMTQNFIFHSQIYLFDMVDAMIFHQLLLTLIGNALVILVGLFSQSRYASIGSLRAIVHIVSLDIFITLIYSLLILSVQSANFHDFIFNQYNF